MLTERGRTGPVHENWGRLEAECWQYWVSIWADAVMEAAWEQTGARMGAE